MFYGVHVLNSDTFCHDVRSELT